MPTPHNQALPSYLEELTTRTHTQAELNQALDAWHALPEAERAATPAAQWIEKQRAVGEHRTLLSAAAQSRADRMRELQGSENERTNQALRARSCTTCFQVKAANGTCACTDIDDD